MRRPARPSRTRNATRVVALLLAVVLAVGVGVGPSPAAAADCSLCLTDLFGTDCGGPSAGGAAGDSCCGPQPAAANGAGDAPTGPADESACPCSDCCLPIGRAPAAVGIAAGLDVSMRPAFSRAAAPVVSRPAGAHTSVFHPPRV